MYVHDVNGHFQHGETVTSTGDGTFSCTIVGENYRGIANEVRTFNIDRVRGIGQERTNAATITMTLLFYQVQTLLQM